MASFAHTLSRRIVFLLFVATFLPAGSTFGQKSSEKETRPNVLFITLDDMNWDSLGCTGCKIPGITPHIDKLASEGMRIEHAHVTIAVCQPTRSVWLTGRYPHNNGALGFQPINPKVPTLTEQLRKAGYFNGIMAKVPHLTPQYKFAWDVVVPASELRVGRDPKSYYEHAKKFFEQARKANKPFFLMANSQDPHRPFARSQQEKLRKKIRKTLKKNQNQKAKARKKRSRNYPPASRYYRPDEVSVPDFLPDIPPVRLEIAEYFTSVHRADEIVGAVLRALDETGFRKNTIVVFMSDHGMPLPFAKTNCYFNSTRTPLIVRWPGQIKAGVVDRRHMVSGIDFTPTILEAVGLKPLQGVDGRSYLSILKGEKQDRRDDVYTVFHRTAARRDYPMRSVVTRQFGYIYNAWSDGKTVFRNESQSGRTWRAMMAAGRTNPKIASRVKLFSYRVKEELYDYANDPNALQNLIDDPKYAKTLANLRSKMRAKMNQYGDPLLSRFQREIFAKP